MKRFNENWDGIVRNKNTATLSEAIDWQGDKKKYTFKGVGANGPYTAIFDMTSRNCMIQLNQGPTTHFYLSPQNNGEIQVMGMHKSGRYITFALITNKSEGKVKIKQDYEIRHSVKRVQVLDVERTVDAVKVSTLNNIGAFNEFAKWAAANVNKIQAVRGQTDTEFESAYKKEVRFMDRMADKFDSVVRAMSSGSDFP